MRVIIPMAGRGSRLRPHTLNTPKPLIPIAGKAMVQRIVEDLTQGAGVKVEEIAYVIGDFGVEVERSLIAIAEEMGAKGSIYYQDQPLGPGHAILCAKESLHGPAIVAFSDTLFKADFNFDTAADAIIWTKKVENPASFGVVKTDKQGFITEFVEKSPVFVSDLAIVGLYYFKDAGKLRDELQHMIDNNITDKGEFQITTALERLKNKGDKFAAHTIEEWLDCGNKDNVIDTNKRMLEIKSTTENLIAHSAILENAVIIPPCFIGEGTVIRHAVIGPHVSIGGYSLIEHSVIVNSLVQDHTKLKHANLSDSMIGSHVVYHGHKSDISIGDYTQFSA